VNWGKLPAPGPDANGGAPPKGTFFFGLWGLTPLIPLGLDILAALVFVIFALLMLAHRLLWPVLNRPVYVLATSRGVRRKLLVFAGVTSFSLASGKVPEAVRKIIEIFG
jgi:hypothetical protein